MLGLLFNLFVIQKGQTICHQEWSTYLSLKNIYCPIGKIFAIFFQCRSSEIFKIRNLVLNQSHELNHVKIRTWHERLQRGIRRSSDKDLCRNAKHLLQKLDQHLFPYLNLKTIFTKTDFIQSDLLQTVHQCSHL